MRGSVSVSEDGSIQQNITWHPPAPPGAVKYLIRYGMNVSREEDASSNVTTPNTSIVLTLSVPEGSPDMVVYNIWVAVITESQEQGNFTMLKIQYSSESGLLQSLNVYHYIIIELICNPVILLLYVTTQACLPTLTFHSTNGTKVSHCPATFLSVSECELDTTHKQWRATTHGIHSSVW